VWDLTTGARLLFLRFPGRPVLTESRGSDLTYGCPNVFKVNLSDDGSFLATADGDGLAHVWNLDSGARSSPSPPPTIYPRRPAGRPCVLLTLPSARTSRSWLQEGPMARSDCGTS
jgi:WD40 repeat protein